MVTITARPSRITTSAVGALLACLAAMLAIQEAGVRGQTAASKLTTVLGDLARSVPQDTSGGAFGLATPLALTAMPRSVRDAAASRRLRLDANNTVQVYILMSEVTDQNVRRLASAGAKVEFTDVAGHRVQARVAARSLQRLAGLPFVNFVRLPSYATRHTGSVVSDGEAIHGSGLARAQFGVDGTGVKVGVISDGIKGVFGTKCQTCGGTPGGPIASGDLPDADGTRRNGVLVAAQRGIVAESFRSDEDLEDTHSFFQPCAFRGAGAEGTALLEIVHDLAPGAELAFANADTSLSFNAAVNALAAVNDIVVDDLGFLGEPADGQSSVSRNTAAALNNPGNRIRTYITSVGNAANDHYFGPYVDSGRDGSSVSGITTSGRLHLFQRTNETTDVLGLGDQPYDLISLPTSGEVVVVLTWNDPSGLSANNYDLYLVDDDTGEVVARSTDVQRGGQDPLEAIDFLNRGETGFFRIVVQNVGDQAAARNLNMFAFQPQCAVDGPRRLASGRHERHNYNTPSRSVLAQSDSGGSPVSAISVGAVCSASAAAAGVFAGSDAPSESCSDVGHSTIQFFSSRGPTLDDRLKPDIAAIDGVAITGAGRFSSPFFGTSAAAPHVAGMAALALHAAPCLQSGASGAVSAVAARTTLRDLVVSSADPVGGTVPNTTFGFGLANAFRTVQRALLACPGSTPAPPTPPSPPPAPPSPPGDAVANLRATFREGQTFITFQEVANSSATYRVYRSQTPITTVNGLTPIATLASGSGTDRYTGTGFVIENLGAPLAAGFGLLVWTPDAPCSCYYAVTTSASSAVVAGTNATTTAVSESVASVPGAVLLEPPAQPQGAGTNRYYRYMAWEKYATWDHARWGYYGHRFTVTTPATLDASNYLMVGFHSAGNTGFWKPHEPTSLVPGRVMVWFTDLEWRGFTDPYTGTGHPWTDYYGNTDGSRVQKNTVLRVRRYTQWVTANPTFAIDPTRVYATGASYGGGGAMHFALWASDLIAAANPSIGWVNKNVLGSLDIGYDGLPTADGPVWDNQMDQQFLIANFAGDAPPIVYTYNKDDATVNPGPYPALFTAVEGAKQAYAARWRNGNHAEFYETGAWDATRFKKNEAYPAFGGAATSDNPASVQEGQRNITLDWSSSLHDLFGGAADAIVDTPPQFGMTFQSLAADTTVNVTIRNAQQFRPSPGQSVTWSNVRASNGQTLQSGTVSADGRGLVTVPGLQILAAGSRLTLSR
jgi:subtilase family protein